MNVSPCEIRKVPAAMTEENSSEMGRRVVWYKFAKIPEKPAVIKMQIADYFKTSVNF
jgi:hypothetical protein